MLGSQLFPTYALKTCTAPRSSAARQVAIRRGANVTLPSLIQWGKLNGGERGGASVEEALGRRLHGQLQPLPQAEGCEEVPGRRSWEKVQTETPEQGTPGIFIASSKQSVRMSVYSPEEFIYPVKGTTISELHLCFFLDLYLCMT